MTSMTSFRVMLPPVGNLDDDDGMPPLVDNPMPMPPLVDNPSPFMTFTFAANMSPPSFNPDFEPEPATRFEVLPDDDACNTPPSSPGLERTSHTKKRDTGYIPRPPNAFILFRSSFIRAQHVTENIEGNRSTLSKIIGKYWKALPREEREVWEAKAVKAQADHRRKYPDWRFSPGANALAKVKDGPRKRNYRKGRGGAEEEERSREKRCAKIADLLTQGKTGSDLESAIQEYDKSTKEGGGANGGKLKVGLLAGKDKARSAPQCGVDACSTVKREDIADASAFQGERVCQTPDPSSDMRFRVPLTAMFKRSSSAPAPGARVSLDGGQSTYQGLPPPSVSVFECLSPASTVDDDHEGIARGQNDAALVRNTKETPASPLPALKRVAGENPVLTWNDELSPFETGARIDATNGVLFGQNDALKHCAGQVPPPASAGPDGFIQSCNPGDLIPGPYPTNDTQYNSLMLSPYSSLEGWAGEETTGYGFDATYVPQFDPVIVTDSDPDENYPGFAGIDARYQAFASQAFMFPTGYEQFSPHTHLLGTSGFDYGLAKLRNYQ